MAIKTLAVIVKKRHESCLKEGKQLYTKDLLPSDARLMAVFMFGNDVLGAGQFKGKKEFLKVEDSDEG